MLTEPLEVGDLIRADRYSTDLRKPFRGFTYVVTRAWRPGSENVYAKPLTGEIPGEGKGPAGGWSFRVSYMEKA